MKIVAVLMALVGLVIGGVGASMAWDQDDQIRTFQPVPATVLSSTVKMTRGSKGSKNYQPVVEYRYEVNGAQYTSKRVYPLSRKPGKHTSDFVVARHPPGFQTQAYINPNQPGEAFLLREHSMAPHLISTVGMAVFAVGLLLPGWTRTSVAAPEPSSGGWFQLQPSRTVRSKARSWGTGALAWLVIVGLGLGSFVLVTERPLSDEAVWVPSIAAALGLIPLLVAGYYWRMAGAFGEALVVLERERLAIGTSVRAKVEQLNQRGGRIDELKAGLVCLRTVQVKKGNKTSTNTSSAHEKWTTLVTDRDSLPGDTLSGSLVLAPPPDASPTSTPDEKGRWVYPKYEWFVAVRTSARGKPDYRGWFPVQVLASDGRRSGTL